MARILHNDEWYEEIASWGHYESEFEKILEQKATQLFANYHLVPFKTIVVSEDDAKKPDFALIHKSYSGWWVVEVELGHHSLESHVLPQVRTFARAKYGPPEAEYLCQQDTALARSRLIDMFKGSQPRVLVIVNAPVDGWADRLRPFGANVVICQVFRSRLNRYVLRLNGEYPSEDDEVVTTCECAPMLHRMLVIHAPASLPVGKGERVLLYYEGRASEWQRTDTARQVFLVALRNHNLKLGQQYEIVRQGDDTLVIRLSGRQKIQKGERKRQCPFS